MVESGLSAGAIVETGKKIIEGGGFKWELLEHPYSTNIDCTQYDCPKKSFTEDFLLTKTINSPFKNWSSSEVWIKLNAELDGCNVKNARLSPGDNCIIPWYISRTFEISVNSVLNSIIKAESSKCTECCPKAECIEFDVSLSSLSWIGDDFSESFVIRICGDGSYTIR